ncbi:MAG: MgtC/SapB family protein [Candidatus Omnitrophica bacterium]|nr:MgtC/SapB family protein [Candidatus Omnitrophota bacterium]
MIDIYEITSRLVLAAVLSGLIGYEREVHGRAAGLRTTILVGVGSCLMMILSMYLHAIYAHSADVDPSRIAAQVVSGIGFLGAGTIIRYGSSVRGLTTAAGLWAVAGIGLAVGCGFYPAALMATGIIFVVLVSLSRFERKIRKRFDKILKIEISGGIDKFCQVTKTISDFQAVIKNVEVKPAVGKNVFRMILTLEIYDQKLSNEITKSLVKVEGISTVKWV